MSTSGSFNPPAGPACPTNVHTRAALLALRTAGTLRVECHYLVTGPVIGTAGNTSPTVIEMHAVSPTELALEAKVHTDFSPNAWEGLFDIDRGTAGSIVRLVGDWNNVAVDTNPNSPTVHNQIPWHKGGDDFRDNFFEDAVLPGWDTAVGTLEDNTIRDSTIDLTGMDGGAPFPSLFSRNTVTDSNIVLGGSADHVLVETNQLADLTVNKTGTGRFAMFGTVVLGGQINIDAATSASFSLGQSVVGTDYRIDLVGKTGDEVNIAECRLYGDRTVPVEFTARGTGEFLFFTCEVTGGVIDIDGPGLVRFEGDTLGGANITAAAGSVGELHIMGSTITNAAITVGAANAAVDNLFDRCIIRGGNFDLLGPLAGGRNDFLRATILELEVGVAPTATGGVQIDGGLYNRGTVLQTRTAGTSSLALTACGTLGAGCLVTNSGATIPGAPVELNRVVLTESQVNMTGVSSGSVTDVNLLSSQLDVSGTSVVSNGRMLASALTTGGFDIDVFTMDGATKTLAASTSGRAASVAFDNF